VILYFSENFSIKVQILGEFWDTFIDGIFMKKGTSKATGTYTKFYLNKYIFVKRQEQFFFGGGKYY
jgi:hypothetical protein